MPGGRPRTPATRATSIRATPCSGVGRARSGRSSQDAPLPRRRSDRSCRTPLWLASLTTDCGCPGREKDLEGYLKTLRDALGDQGSAGGPTFVDESRDEGATDAGRVSHVRIRKPLGVHQAPEDIAAVEAHPCSLRVPLALGLNLPPSPVWVSKIG